MMSDIYGLISKKLLAIYDQVTSSWKMSEGILALDLAQSLQTLPKSGMTQDGKLYELVTLVQHIKEQDSSLLPTPLARDYKGVDGRKVGLEAKLLPTPTAMHVRNHDEPIQAYEQRVMDYTQGKTKGKLGASTGLAVRWKNKQYRLHWLKVN